MRFTNLFKILGLSAALAMPLVGCDDDDTDSKADSGTLDSGSTDVKPGGDTNSDVKLPGSDAQGADTRPQTDGPAGDAPTGDATVG